MPTLDESWSPKLRRIGEIERPDHWYLTHQDECFYFGEYTPRAGYGHSSTNQLIHNLKKGLQHKGTAQWRYKQRAISDCGAAIASNLKSNAEVVIIPMPPSKCPGSPEYDDRMLQVAKAIGSVQVRDIIYTLADREALHASCDHRDQRALRAKLGMRSEKGIPPRNAILLDDLVTTGCSFTVCKAMLAEEWPETRILGIFIARRTIQHSATGHYLS